MSPGEVSFFDRSAVAKARNVSKEAAVVKRIEKTRQQRPIDELYEAKERREKEQRANERAQKIREKEQAELWKKDKEERSYDRLFTDEKMTTNATPMDEDDFM